MRFSNFCRLLLIAGSLLWVSACGTLDNWVDPLFDEPRDQSVGSDDNDASKENGDEEVSDEKLVDKAAKTLDFGPNPFYGKATSADAETMVEYQRGVDAMRSEQWSRAESIFSALADRNRSLSGPLLNMGIAQWRQDKLELAQNNFEAAIKVNNANQEAYNQLALLHRSQGRFAEAKKYYQRAINVWPGYPSIRVNLGILYELYLGELPKALEQYEMYQQLRQEPDRKVAGWIIDLKRRIDS